MSYSILRVFTQHPIDEILAVSLAIPRIFDSRMNNLLVNRKGTIRLPAKWEFATYKLISHDPKRPQISLKTVTLTRNNLRRHIMGRANDRLGLIPTFQRKNLGSPQINQLQISITAHHDILGLQIPINNLEGMQMFNNHEDLCY